MARDFDIKINGDASGAIAAFQGLAASAVGSGSRINRALVGTGASRMAMLGLGAAAVAGAVGLARLGQRFQEIDGIIRRGTGATGDALEELRGSFRRVAVEVPSSMEDSATAIADLNTTLGLTGSDLEAVSVQMLNLTRMTDMDLSGAITDISRLFKDWGVETEEMPGRLDQLWRAAQTTGIEVDQLAKLMVQFGAPMRQFGLDFDFAAAMFSSFQREGVNMESIMPGIRRALSNLSDPTKKVADRMADLGIEGGNLEENLVAVMDAIKNAGSETEANAIAFDIFGKRAGADMGAAIREGRFELDDLIDTIANGSETINAASEETLTLGERWERLKNQVFIKLEPIARKVFDVLEKGMKALEDHPGLLDRLIMGFGALVAAIVIVAAVIYIKVILIVAAVTLVIMAFMHFKDEIIGAVMAVRDFLAPAWDFIFRNFIRPLVDGFMGIVHWFQTNWDTIATVFATTASVIATVVGVVVGVVVTLWQAFVTAFGFIVTGAGVVWNVLQPVFSGIATVVGVIVDVVVLLWQGFVTAFGFIVTALTTAWSVMQPVFSAIMTVIGLAIQVFQLMATIIVVVIAGVVIAAFLMLWQTITNVVVPVIRWLWEQAVNYFSLIGDVISWVWENIIGPVFRALVAFVRNVIVPTVIALWNAAVFYFDLIAAAIRWAWENIIGPVFRALRNFIMDRIVPAVLWLWHNVIEPAWEGIRSAISSAWRFIRDNVFDPMMGFLDTVMDAFDDFKSGIARVWRGIRSGAASAWRSIISTLRGPINTVIGFINKIITGINWVLDALPGLSGDIDHIPDISSSAGRTGAGDALSSAAMARAATGARVGSGFETNGPQVLVGEGKQRYPEYVIPTDPAYRGRAAGLASSLMGDLGLRPMAIGGVIDAFDDARDWVGDRFSDGVSWVKGELLEQIFKPVNDAVRRGLDGVTNILHVADMGQGLRKVAWDWVRGVDSKGLDKATFENYGGPGGGAGPGGVQQWRGVGMMALRMAGQSPSWIGDLLTQMNHESGGNPRAVNRWDSNWIAGHPSVGLMQMIRGSYQQYKRPGLDRPPHAYGVSMDPLSNVAAAVAYTVGKFGSLGRWRAGGFKGYNRGGIVGSDGGAVHPREMVLTMSDQERLLKLIRGGVTPTSGGSVNFAAGSVVFENHFERGTSEREVERLTRAQSRAFRNEIGRRRVRADAKLRK